MPLELNITRVFGRSIREVILLNGVIAVTDGEWFAVDGASPVTIHIKGITNATVSVHGANTDVQPANSSHEIQLTVNIKKDDLVIIDVPVKWIKVRVSAYTSGTIFAYLIGQA